MIKLNQSASQYLQLITGQNGAVVDVSYSDKSSADFLGDSQLTSIVTATTTTICDTPAASVVRYIDFIAITNTYAGNHTITVQQNSSATAYPIVKDLVMSVGDRLEYTHAYGWRVVDSTGAIHTVVASPQFVIAAGKTHTVNNSLTFSGTDSTTHTFPSTSSTIARTDAAQTFSGTQTFSSSPVIPVATAATHAVPLAQFQTITNPTLTLSGSTSNPTTPVTIDAFVSRSGREVTVVVRFSNVNTTGASGNLQITGLPVAPSTDLFYQGIVAMLGFGIAPAACLVSGTTILIYDAVTLTAIAMAAGTGKYLYVQVKYFTA